MLSLKDTIRSYEGIVSMGFNPMTGEFYNSLDNYLKLQRENADSKLGDKKRLENESLEDNRCIERIL